MSRAVDFYQTHCIEFRINRFCARFPWKLDHPELATNLLTYQRRTRSTVKRLAKQPGELQRYGEIFLDQLQRGFIERVPNYQLSKRECHYVPHFGVASASSTTPLRIVNDYSCKTMDGVSLNDCLEVGPPLQNVMLAILLRQRVYPIGLAADIQKAFHQILLHEADRDFTRFLWLSDASNPESEFITYRSRGARCSPFILLSVIKKLLLQNPSKVTRDMDSSLYVDNLITGCNSEKEALEYYHEANSILNKAGLQLKTWGSNSELIETKAKEEEVGDSSHQTKLLGLLWNRKTDQLQLPVFQLNPSSQQSMSKREVLRGISTVFDPLGIISPITIPAKILMQDLWTEKLE